ESDLAERDDDADAWKRGDLAVEMRETVCDLLGRRLVVGRRASHRGGDERIGQSQAVVRMLRRRDVRESVTMKGGHQEVARAAGGVGGEEASGRVGAVRGGRESDDQHARARIAEAGDWLAPVDVVAIRAPFRARDLAAIRAQPWAAVAGDDLLVD